MEALALDHFADQLVEKIVVDRLGDLVTRLGRGVRGLENEVHLQALSGLFLIGAGAVVSEDRQALEADGGQGGASEEVGPDGWRRLEAVHGGR